MGDVIRGMVIVAVVIMAVFFVIDWIIITGELHEILRGDREHERAMQFLRNATEQAAAREKEDRRLGLKPLR